MKSISDRCLSFQKLVSEKSKSFIKTAKEKYVACKKKAPIFWKWFFGDQIRITGLLGGSCVVVIVILATCLVSDWIEFFEGLVVEAGGMVFDIVIFGIILALYTRSREEKEYIERQVEIIEDFKSWNSKEGNLRIAGALRRLVRRKVSKFNLYGIKLSDFDFYVEGIKNISGSNFRVPLFGRKQGRPNHYETCLYKVRFSSVLCVDVTFSNGPFGTTKLTNCDFVNCDLTRAVFNYALIKYDTEQIVRNKSDWFSYEEDNEGRKHAIQDHYPPFSGADLTDTNFTLSNLKNVDFRDSLNIDKAKFRNCKGIETCLFDNHVDVQKLLDQ